VVTESSRIQGGIEVLSNVVASSSDIHVKYGGIVPEVAAREQILSVIPVIKEALIKFSILNYQFSDINKAIESIDKIAVAVGPGLLGSLLIGVETAKSLAWAWDKPLIGVNHMHGHVLANWIVQGIGNRIQGVGSGNKGTGVPILPAVALVVSGGHTELILIRSMDDWEFLGGTRDDAAGECFDKTARIIGLGYPGGPQIAKAASEWKGLGKEKTIKLPRPMIHENTLDMSFSGLKAAVGKVCDETQDKNRDWQLEVAHEINEAVVDSLCAKTWLAVERYNPKSLLVAGGVSANTLLRESLVRLGKDTGVPVFMPHLNYCTDNAAMIGAAGILKPMDIDLMSLQPKPGLVLV
jgi:N6-L-threonylcarbamoyladenine synthase